MFQIFVLNQKVFKKVAIITFLKLFINAMIKNIKIQKKIILLKIQNLWNLINVLIQKNYEKKILNVSYDFSKFDESRNIKV
jgi:hypothetical protein